jgi:hypothetical protein
MFAVRKPLFRPLEEMTMYPRLMGESFEEDEDLT